VIVIDPACLRDIVDAAEAAYPDEACGLLVGRAEKDAGAAAVHVASVAASANLASAPGTRFEIDPALRLRLQRELRGGSTSVVGLYHSHPDGVAQPSPRDLEAAWEPDLVWLVTAVAAGQAIHTSAHVLIHDGNTVRFSEVPLHTSDWRPTTSRGAIEGGGIA
jgi:proteasome lid subunit RPN8/RPN11